jgi:hypothetical protein
MSDQPYYTIDTALFSGQFRYFGPNRVDVRGKAHTEQEQYRKGDVNQEITPISITQGERTYVHLRPYVQIPDLRITVGLYKRPSETGAIGEVIGGGEVGHKEVEIGNAQAWYYPSGELVLWECFLHSFVQDHAIHEDPNMRSLWEGFTRFLVQQFPSARRVVTTAHDPMFETAQYQTFLRSLGYESIAKAAFGKMLDKASGQ